MNGNKKSLPVIIVILQSFVLLCGCSGTGSADGQNASSADDEERVWLDKQNFRNTADDAYTG